MAKQKNYPGLDVLKLFLALFVVQRHLIQIFFPERSPWQEIIGYWLSNLSVPLFFTIAGFLLFRKLDEEHPDFSVVTSYCWRMVKLYVLWSAIYLPIDFYNWIHEDGHTVARGVLTYFHHFLFDSTTPQLWYLPALAVACLVVGWLFVRGVGKFAIFGGGLSLFAIGTLANNWFFNQRFPQALTEVLHLYERVFLSMRNGIFYGICFVALGLCLARVKKRPPVVLTFAGAAAGLFLTYWESNTCFETNFVFTTVFAALFLFMAAESFKPTANPVFPVIRKMSEWIYFAHFYFFYFLVWTQKWNPVPFTFRTVTYMLQGSIFVFALLMTLLSGTKRGNFLKKFL